MSEDTESSETQDLSPEVAESESQTESSGAETQAAAPEEPKEEPSIPFHEHPRFKEVLEQRRAFKEQLDQAKGYMEALQKEMQALRQPAAPQAVKEPKYKPLIEQLKAVNPEFAGFQEEILNKLEQYEKRAEIPEQLQKRLDAYEQRELQNNVKSSIQSLYEANKVPETVRERYQLEMEAIVHREEAQGKKLGLQDVERVFKSVHNTYQPFLENLRRETLKGYVQAKAQDTAPTPVTGGAAISSSTKKLRADDEVGLVQWLAKGLREGKKI
jgi:hypothetical protein